MAQIADISQALGDFMLKGYVLTDQSCPALGCAIPMLRTPRGKTPAATFCVKCNDGGSSASTLGAASKTPVSSSRSSRQFSSRSSTPPTEVSDAPGSTHSDFELPPETDDMRQRREQSDRASSELAKRLLQGWTMLGDECLNENCYGVPLVSPSRAKGAADLRKECVICGTMYKTEIDWAGRENLVPYNDDTVPVLSPDPPTKRQRTSSPLRPDSHLDIPFRNKNRSTERKPQPVAMGDTLGEASEALQISLGALSSQLRRLSSSANLDSNLIGMTADAIGKVTQALSQVRQLLNPTAT